MILSDSDVMSFGMPAAVSCMEDAFRMHAAGQLASPSRAVSELAQGTLVFTPGGAETEDPIVGFRYYDLQQLGSPRRSEVTAVFSATDGEMKGMVVGTQLGAMRTGAIGGVALKYLSAPEARTLALIGTGFQARSQLQAALAVRDFATIRVFSRNTGRREAFASEMSRLTGREITVVDRPRDAVQDADAVIATTVSDQPVLEASWLKESAYLANVGPKFCESHELPLSVYSSASMLVTDAPAQWQDYGQKLAAYEMAKPRTLSSIVADGRGLGGEAQIVFVSLGLAGTELVLADRILQTCR